MKFAGIKGSGGLAKIISAKIHSARGGDPSTIDTTYRAYPRGYRKLNKVAQVIKMRGSKKIPGGGMFKAPSIPTGQP